MKVEILKPKAYCAGVSNAIKLAYKAREENPNKKVYVLGMLVHNNFVVEELKKKDIQVALDINAIPNGEVIIFSAHGHKRELDEIAKQKNLIIYDSVCPKVLNNMKLIEDNVKADHYVIYIGQKGHPEAEACLSLYNKVILYTNNILNNYHIENDDSPLVINQTTLSILDIKSIHEEILRAIPKARIANEICGSTRLRQEAILSLDKDVDLIIVVGDNNSSNTKRLLEVAEASHPEVASLMIADASELDMRICANKNHIVISSGASTPEDIIDAVYNKIVNY
ncbi:MAG: 4-hydroxy-3-methylbut-2-enyl diphosphate reductase [Bacilli bacterium]|nr:4-hydroxy-3-methylbut-2-enyl diphosphate reductase [Bacilli bacterium]